MLWPRKRFKRSCAAAPGRRQKREGPTAATHQLVDATALWAMGRQGMGEAAAGVAASGSPPQSTTAMANPEHPGALEDKLDAVLLAIDGTQTSLESTQIIENCQTA
ncbi:hypothetical protein NDU88_001697 [Pleurodeles waltl]|uniref:Uncharacterized protein n=1 Tax=Pleurodeles waltl TaxID=8319 RepID=A0AAV7QAL5_PLEWA|nr:hypothetical protein NDU88_001697 [Pleurodeles waltl]